MKRFLSDETQFAAPKARVLAFEIPPGRHGHEVICSYLTPNDVQDAEARVVATSTEKVLQNRAITRWALARELGCSPLDLVFAKGPFGKPIVSMPDRQSSIAFSFSRAQDVALLAIVPAGSAGVDIERAGLHDDIAALASEAFCEDELRGLLNQPPAAHERCFLDIWTIKEAVTKALGVGLQLPFSSFSAAPAEDGVVFGTTGKSLFRGDWKVVPLMAPENYVAHLAVAEAEVPDQELSAFLGLPGGT